jgi:hypothetical protein
MCNPLVDPACVISTVVSGINRAASDATSSVAGDFLGKLADGVRDGVSWILTSTTSWWVRLPSPDLATNPAVSSVQRWFLPLTAAVAVAGVIAAGLRMVLTRKMNPLLDVGAGLAAIAAAATLGIAVPDLLLRAGDSWSSWVLNASSGGAPTSRLSSALELGSAPSVIVIVFGLLAMIMATVQAALLVFRQAAVIILAAVLPLAAAGVTSPLTRAWIRKIISWMLALICYKPAAAAVYATAFTMIGTGTGLRTVMMGFVMLALSLLAMPVLMRFFTWTTGAVSSGGGGQLLGMAAAGAVAMGALRGSGAGAGGGSAEEHSSYLKSQQSSSAQADGAATTSQASNPPAAPAGSPAGSAGNCVASGPAGAESAGAAAAGGAAAGPEAASAAASGGASAASGAAAAASAGTAGIAGVAVAAAQGLASGAKNTAASATEEGEQR